MVFEFYVNFECVNHLNSVCVCGGRVLLLGRLTHALCELSPHLTQCMSTAASDKTDTARWVRKRVRKDL